MLGSKVARFAEFSGRAWTLPGVTRIRRSRYLNTLLRRGHGSHWGRFATYEEAAAYLPASRRVGYDCPEIVRVNMETLSQIHLSDWPVLFFLQRAIDAGLRSMVDFGGHVGVKYAAFKRHIDLGPEFKWQVMDVPAVCAEGRNQSGAAHEHLSFHEDVADIASCDILLCSGALQYARLSLSDLVAGLPTRPRLILVNKVGVVDGDGFFTLEDFGYGRMPYQVFPRDHFPGLLDTLGYDRVGQWTIPDREFAVRSARGDEWVSQFGGAWMDRTH